MDKLALYIEALVFAATSPVDRKDIRYALENAFEVKIAKEDIEAALNELQQKYMSDAFAFELVEIAEGFEFLTKPAYYNVIGSYLKQVSKRRLSKVALETLAIIAYKQPVTKSQLEQIRGVNSDYAVQKLLEKELIEISGRSDTPGRPLTYVTSEKFMDYFGLKTIADLPKLKDLQTGENIFAGIDQLDEPLSDEQSSQSSEEQDEEPHEETETQDDAGDNPDADETVADHPSDDASAEAQEEEAEQHSQLTVE